MKIEEHFTVNAPIDVVWNVIRDATVIAPCVPGCGAVEILDDYRYRATIGVALGPIKAQFQLAIEVTEEVPGQSVATVARGEEGGRASSLTARSLLRLDPVSADETDIHYESDVTLTGRLGNYGLGLMKKRAQVLGQEFARNLRTLLASRVVPEGATSVSRP